MKIASYFKFAACVVMITLLSVLNLSGQADSVPAVRQITPEELVKLLQLTGEKKPLVFHVGPHMLYTQSHVAGSEYIGMAMKDAGLQKLKDRVERVPRSTFIV